MYIAAPSAAPVQLSIRLLSPESLFVSWLPPTTEEQNGVIRSYSVSVQNIATANLTLWTSSLLNITIESLHPYYEYKIAVAAKTVALGPYSSFETVTMPESGIFITKYLIEPFFCTPSI